MHSNNLLKIDKVVYLFRLPFIVFDLILRLNLISDFDESLKKQSYLNLQLYSLFLENSNFLSSVETVHEVFQQLFPVRLLL